MMINKNENKVISFLPPDVAAEWTQHFETVQLARGQILHEIDTQAGYLYFPTTAIVSCLNVLTNGDTTEVAVTGNEGVIGICLLMGDSQSTNLAQVQKTGDAIRIRLSVVRNTLTQGIAVQKLFLGYLQALMTHMSQVSVCHKHHTLVQQLSRLLLLTLERQDGDNIEMTHELMANLLGVRRESVSTAARKLMKENVLEYSRGNICVVNQKLLVMHSCECHGIIHRSYQQFFSNYK